MISVQSGLSVFGGAKWLQARPDRMGKVGNEVKWLWMRSRDVAQGRPSPDFREFTIFV